MTPASDHDQTTDPLGSCPVAAACEACADVAGPRDVYEADTPVGAVCLTLCPACVDAAQLPRLSLPGAVWRALEHGDHTGGDLDDTGIDPGGPPGAWGPCARCGQMFPERDDRPYCAACEDVPHDMGGELW